MERGPEDLLVDFAVACRNADPHSAVREKAVHRLVDAPTPPVEAADRPLVRAGTGTIAPAGREAMTARSRVGEARAAVGHAVLLDADTTRSDLDRLLFAFVDGSAPAPSFDDLFAELAAPLRGGRSHPVHEGEPCLSSTSR